MLAVEGWLAVGVLTVIAYAIGSGGSQKDRRDAIFVFAVASLTAGLMMFRDQPSVALTLQAMLGLEAVGLATVLIQARRT